MPEYIYQCPNNHWYSEFLHVRNHSPIWICSECGEVGQQVITAPSMVKVAEDVCYDSPVTGEPITSWAKRQEDLKRTNSVPYDPGMKQDHERKLKEAEVALDKSIDQHVERAIEKMPTAKRGKLYSELTEQGTSLGLQRH